MNLETIIVAAIAALGPLIGTILTLHQQSKFIDYRVGEIEEKIVELGTKVEKHNSFDRRLVAIETKLDIKREEKSA